MRKHTAPLPLSRLLPAVLSLYTALSVVPSISIAQTPKLTIKPLQTSLLAGNRGLLPVLLTIQAPEADRTSSQSPLNVAVAVNLDPKLSADSLASVRNAVLAALTLLRAKDRAAVLRYGSSVDIVLPSTSIAKSAVILNQVPTLDASSGNNHFAGLSKAAAELETHVEDYSRNAIIIIVSTPCNRTSFAERHLVELTKALESDNITTSVIGLGSTFDESCLHSLARAGQGRFHYAASPVALSNILERELQFIRTTHAKRAFLQLNTEPTGQIVRILPIDTFEQETETKSNAAQVVIAPLIEAREQSLLIELSVQTPRELGEFQLLTAALVYQTRDGSSGVVSKQLSLKSTDERYEPELSTNLNVSDSHEQAKARQIIYQAAALFEQQQLEEATRLLASSAEDLRRKAKKTKRPALLTEAVYLDRLRKRLQSTTPSSLRKELSQTIPLITGSEGD